MTDAVEPEPPKPTTSGFQWLWPTITDRTSARKAASQGATAAFLCSGVTVLAVVVGRFYPSVSEALGTSAFALIDAAIFAAFGVGTLRCSRVSAVGGLLFYVLERVMAWRVMSGGNAVLVIVLLSMFVTGVRGAFNYHRTPRDVPDAP